MKKAEMLYLGLKKSLWSTRLKLMAQGMGSEQMIRAVCDTTQLFRRPTTCEYLIAMMSKCTQCYTFSSLG